MIGRLDGRARSLLRKLRAPQAARASASAPPMHRRQIGRHSSDAEILALFERIAARWRADGRAWPDYAASYGSVEAIRAARVFTHAAIASKVAGFDRSVGCEFGCWLGFPCVLHLAAGCAEVYGVDILPEFIAIAERWARDNEIERVTFAPIETSAAPLPSRSMDWVLVNQVLCNARVGSTAHVFSEAWRILRPGGVLILADSNNPYCADTKARLKATFRTLEIGEGDDHHPRGSNFLHRAAVIRARIGVAVEASEALARETCYLWGDELIAAATRRIEGGDGPGSRFRSDDVNASPVNPENGLVFGAITDPFAIAAALESHGFATDITVTPGGGAHAPAMVLDMLKRSQGFYVYGYRP